MRPAVSRERAPRYPDGTMSGPIPVEVLHTPGCSNWQAAREALYRVAEEVKAAVELTDTVIDSLDVAEALRFVGSPTVRVHGHDVQPEANQRSDFGLG
jgi:hypothetical protein